MRRFTPDFGDSTEVGGSHVALPKRVVIVRICFFHTSLPSALTSILSQGERKF
jgi:hypothetical protein